MPFRFGSSLVLVVMSLTAGAQAPVPVDDAQWLQRSRAILERSAGESMPEWLTPQSTDLVLQAAEEISQRARGVPPRVDAHAVPGRILIFASFSIPRPTLQSLLSQASEPNVVLVFRGVPRGTTVPETVRRLKRLVSEEQSVPQVILDPTLFRRYGIERVPSLVLERAAGQVPVTAIGAVSTNWLRRMAATLQPGQEVLGKRAEDYEIAEADLIEDMQRRLMTIDWGARREAAQSRFWPRRAAKFVVLPDAREHREMLIDPSVRVTRDLKDAEGKVLVSAGHTLNPLQYVPLTKTIIVFRGTDSRHVAKATELARAVRATGRGVILLTTSVDAQRGWNHLAELERTFSGAVYVLPQELLDRFELARIPATVASRGPHLVVTEIPVGGEP